VRQGDILRCPAELETGGGPIGRHLFRVGLVAPDGGCDAALGYNAEAPGGKAEIDVPLAYNEQTGTWTLRVRDVATGVTGEARVEVNGRAEDLP